MWNNFKLWIASKGGASHIAAIIYIAAVAAYGAVPAFQTLVDNIYAVTPSWFHQLALAVVGLIAWYRNSSGTSPAAFAAATQLKKDKGGVA